MAAFQGWGAGPNFSGVAQNIATGQQLEEQRKARQQKQFENLLTNLRDDKRRKEDQAIAAAAATQAQKNTEATRAVNLYTAISNQSSQLQLREPKLMDFLGDQSAYKTALDTWKNAVDRNQAQLRELEANNPNLRAMLGAQEGGSGTGETKVTLEGGSGTGSVDSLFRRVVSPGNNTTGNAVTGNITGTESRTPVQPGVASSTNNNNLEFGSNAQNNTRTNQDPASRNFLGQAGGALGRLTADLTLPYNPNPDPSNPDERGFFQKAKDLGLDAKSLYTMLEDRAQKQRLGPEVGQEVGLGTDDDVVTTPRETPANLSGEEARGDTPESTRRAIQDTIFNAIEQSRIGLGDMAGEVYDAITTSIDKVIPDGLERRIDAFGKSNLGDREHAQEVLTLEEIAKESAKGAVAGIAGGMSVVLGLTALRTIRPGQRQVVAAAKKKYASLLKRIRKAEKLREYQKKADKVEKARAAREAAKKAKENAERKAREKANKRGQATSNSKVRPKDFLPGNRVNYNFRVR